MAPDLLAWAPSACGSEGPTLSRLTATLGSCSTDKEQALAELCQDFWLALADALSATPGAEANLLLLQWMIGVCTTRCILPMPFLLALSVGDLQLDQIYNLPYRPQLRLESDRPLGALCPTPAWPFASQNLPGTRHQI